jgi:competence protein ComEA
MGCETRDQEHRTAAWLGAALLVGTGVLAWRQARAPADGVDARAGTAWNARLEAVRRIDINAAGVAELVRLPQIGPRLAWRIVEERAAHGRFESAAELTRVPGIGEKTLDRLKDYVTVE